MPYTTHRIGRRALLAAGGTLLTGAASGKSLAAGAAIPWPVTALRAHPPVRLPPLRFVDAAGHARSLADDAGRGIVLNFWATWCAPCVLEMAGLDRLSKNLSGRGIAVLAASEDRAGAQAVRAFYDAHAITHLPVLLDPHMRALAALRLDAIPTTLLIDRQGRAVACIQGPVRWDGPDAAALVSRLVSRL